MEEKDTECHTNVHTWLNDYWYNNHTWLNYYIKYMLHKNIILYKLDKDDSFR